MTLSHLASTATAAEAHAAAFTERCHAIAARLRAGLAVDDAEFDRIYERPHRLLSSAFWTPTDLAKRIAMALVPEPGARVLDIGAGVGKFCLVGALSTEGVFSGVEHRPHLVGVACAAAKALGAHRAHFLSTTFDTLDPSSFDAVYLYNPFQENRLGTMTRIDGTVELSRQRFARDVRAARHFLARLKRGARVATYFGFGAAMPRTYRRLDVEPNGAREVELWIQG